MKEIAKFFCGWEAFHAVMHAYLYLTGTAFNAFGMPLSPGVNAAGALVGAAISMALGRYAWRRSAGR